MTYPKSAEKEKTRPRVDGRSRAGPSMESDRVPYTPPSMCATFARNDERGAGRNYFRKRPVPRYVSAIVTASTVRFRLRNP